VRDNGRENKTGEGTSKTLTTHRHSPELCFLFPLHTFFLFFPPLAVIVVTVQIIMRDYFFAISSSIISCVLLFCFILSAEMFSPSTSFWGGREKQCYYSSSFFLFYFINSAVGYSLLDISKKKLKNVEKKNIYWKTIERQPRTMKFNSAFPCSHSPRRITDPMNQAKIQIFFSCQIILSVSHATLAAKRMYASELTSYHPYPSLILIPFPQT